MDRNKSMKDPEEAFETAVAELYSSSHQSKTPQAIEAAAARRTRTVSDLRIYLDRIRVDTSTDFTKFRLVHITGTKGKGSTACMCESILRRAHGQRTGLFTSPHLVDIRERIRVNGQPISKNVFGQAYWEIRKRLEEYGPTPDELPVLPGYFRMLTLMVS